MSWAFYPAFLATAVSCIGLTRIAHTYHGARAPHTLSELAAAETKLLERFQLILIICGLLFAITILGFIAPNIKQGILIVIFGVLMVGGELLVALLPARTATLRAHEIAAQVMAVGMLGLAIVFTLVLRHLYKPIELLLSASIVVAGILTVIDKKRYVVYELAFIYASHVSILAAAIAVK